jgi:hypothetical protein
MSPRFECRFAVGADGLAYSGVWFVWTAKTRPDLRDALRAILPGVQPEGCLGFMDCKVASVLDQPEATGPKSPD